MKTKAIITLSLALLAVMGAFLSCDKVKHPNQHPDVYVDCAQNAPIVKTNTATSSYRKVLLEDYTGHTCGNCPPAAATAESLAATYGSSLVVLACHVSKTFAAPKTDTTYREDFRDPAATDWDVFFNQSGSGLPRGMVNRMQPYPQPYSNWGSLITNALAKPMVAKLDLTTSYDPVQKTLNVKVKTTFQKTLTDTVKLVICLAQDSIIADQTDYAPPPGSTLDPNNPSRRLNYRFDHIFVKSLNGTWGDLVKVAPSWNDTVTINRNCNLVSKCWYKDVVCVYDKKISVVAFIYSDATKEILQVEKLKIR